MKTIAKISRKEIKKPDQFITSTKKIFDYISKNLKMSIIAVISVLLPIMIFWGIINFKHKQKITALKEFYALINTDDKDQKKKAVPSEKLEALINKYPKSTGALYAQVYLAQNYFEEKQFDKALALFQETAGLLNPDDHFVFYSAAWEGVGYSLEGTGKYREAITAYEKILKENKTYLKSDLLLSIARCYEALKENASAIDNYSKVISFYPKHPQKDWIEEKIEKLKLTK